MITRRALLAGGLGAAAVLSFGGLLYEVSADEGQDRIIIAAVAPVMLGIEGTAPSVVRGVDVAIAGLPLELRAQIRQLFGLLRFAPTRILIAGVWHPWESASEGEITRFLNAWRYSPVTRLRAAYDALHQLILAAWYGNTVAWTAIGYPGPPKVS